MIRLSFPELQGLTAGRQRVFTFEFCALRFDF